MGNDVPHDLVPDLRDGLSRVQRIVLAELARASAELGRAKVPTVMRYGRVAERIDLTERELNQVLRSLGVQP